MIWNSDTLWQFISLAASAGVLSALVTGALGWVGAWRDEVAQARYLALELSVLLESYAWHLIQALYSDGNAKSSNGQVGNELIYLPPLPAFPKADAVWPTMDIRLVDRAFALRLEVEQSQPSLKDTYDAIGEDGQEYALRSASDAAQTAAILSRDLRYRYGLSQSDGSPHLLETCQEMRRRHASDAT
ncbi:MAG TPA: hypothetical protein VL147_05110 [Devosia sp.]|nr:hypothetical protein [Devosia sp.]